MLKVMGPHLALCHPMRHRPGCSSLSTHPVPLCLFPEVVCTAEAPWGLGAFSPPLQDCHSSSYRAEPLLVPLRGGPQPGMCPTVVVASVCLLAQPPSSNFSTSTALWGTTPTSASVLTSTPFLHLPPSECMTPYSQLEHYKDLFRNEHKTHVLWEPNMRLKSGAFDEIVGKENLLPLG